MASRRKSGDRKESVPKADRMALEAIVECCRDALWSWTPDGTIVRWNAEAQRLFGTAPMKS
jgi:PAS domain-containing protein